MEEDFLEQRVKLVRDLASRADPFIKKRLLSLADNYDRRIAKPTTAPAPEPAKPPA